VSELFDVLFGAMGLRASLFQRLADDPAALLWPAVGVALLAAASTMLGHIAILLLNHIRGWRLLTSLALSALALALLNVVQAAITWAMAWLILGRFPLLSLLVVGLISTAPLVLNVTTALPHLGLPLGRIWEGWSFMVLIVGASWAFSVPIAWALGFTIAGWLVMQLLSRLLQKPLNWAASRFWTLATGRPTMIRGRDILAGTPIIPVSQPAAEVSR